VKPGNHIRHDGHSLVIVPLKMCRDSIPSPGAAQYSNWRVRLVSCQERWIGAKFFGWLPISPFSWPGSGGALGLRGEIPGEPARGGSSNIWATVCSDPPPAVSPAFPHPSNPPVNRCTSGRHLKARVDTGRTSTPIQREAPSAPCYPNIGPNTPSKSALAAEFHRALLMRSPAFHLSGWPI